jgi:hypothetical protein
VLIIPTYFKDGIKIRVSKVAEGKDKYLGTFTAKDKYNIWFLKKGTQVKFQIEGKQTPGFEAVLMLGIVCDEEHDVFSKLKKGFKK